MLVSRSNWQNGDAVFDENGVLRHKDTVPLPVPTRPVLLSFSAEEAETRRREMCGACRNPAFYPRHCLRADSCPWHRGATSDR